MNKRSQIRHYEIPKNRFLALTLFAMVSLTNVLHPAGIQFVDVTEQAGIHFRHAGGIDLRVVPALVGSGVAWRDYDNDGNLDLYLVNSAAVRPEPGTVLPQNALYRNNGDGTFTDVTETAGVGDTGWGMGCAFADYDNDGDADLYVTNYKTNVFYRNDGEGRFKKFSAGAGGIGHAGFGSGIAWGDYDADGCLDLYVGNYIEYTKIPQGEEQFLASRFSEGIQIKVHFYLTLRSFHGILSVMKTQYVTPRAAAKALGYNVDYLRQLAKRGKIPTIRTPGGH